MVRGSQFWEQTSRVSSFSDGHNSANKHAVSAVDRVTTYKHVNNTRMRVQRMCTSRAVHTDTLVCCTHNHACYCFRAKREQLRIFQELLLWNLLPSRQGHNMAWTVLHVPYSLDSATHPKTCCVQQLYTTCVHASEVVSNKPCQSLGRSRRKSVSFEVSGFQKLTANHMLGLKSG